MTHGSAKVGLGEGLMARLGKGRSTANSGAGTGQLTMELGLGRLTPDEGGLGKMGADQEEGLYFVVVESFFKNKIKNNCIWVGSRVHPITRTK